MRSLDEVAAVAVMRFLMGCGSRCKSSAATRSSPAAKSLARENDNLKFSAVRRGFVDEPDPVQSLRGAQTIVHKVLD
jgi:hypothetical protein